MAKVRYIGKVPGTTARVGIMHPGDIVEVKDEDLEFLLNGWFELVDEKQKVTKKVKKVVKKDCPKCKEE